MIEPLGEFAELLVEGDVLEKAGGTLEGIAELESNGVP